MHCHACHFHTLKFVFSSFSAFTFFKYALRNFFLTFLIPLPFFNNIKYTKKLLLFHMWNFHKKKYLIYFKLQKNVNYQERDCSKKFNHDRSNDQRWNDTKCWQNFYISHKCSSITFSHLSLIFLHHIHKIHPPKKKHNPICLHHNIICVCI